MRKWLFIGALWLSWTSIAALAQGALPLDTFTSPDAAFQFAYPQNYDLLVGERMLTGTQGRHPGIPVCDFATAMACVIYPIANEENTRFEAAAFSVQTVPGVIAESECLNYSDQLSKGQVPPTQPSSISINARVFRHLSSRKKVPGHIQADDLYRTFKQQKCYELHVEVSLAEEPGVQRTSSNSGTNSLGDPRADSARESLRLILSTVVFER